MNEQLRCILWTVAGLFVFVFALWLVAGGPFVPIY
jgi:hypothetical protein